MNFRERIRNMLLNPFQHHWLRSRRPLLLVISSYLVSNMFCNYATCEMEMSSEELQQKCLDQLEEVRKWERKMQNVRNTIHEYRKNATEGLISDDDDAIVKVIELRHKLTLLDNEKWRSKERLEEWEIRLYKRKTEFKGWKILRKINRFWKWPFGKRRRTAVRHVSSTPKPINDSMSISGLLS